MTDERRPPVYVLNRNEGIDILHKDPTERCNQDDAKQRATVDARTADALLRGGSARRCEHCMPEEEATP